MSGGSLYNLDSVISGMMGSDFERRLKEETCLLVWDEVVGKQVAGAAQPEFIRDGCLFVTAKSSVWANELSFYKKDFLSRLNQRVGAQVIKDIIFKTGRITRRRSKPPVKEAERPDIEGIKLTNDELSYIESIAQAAGEEMSGSLRSLLSAHIRLEKWKKAHGWTPCEKCGHLHNGKSGICHGCEMVLE